MFKWAYDGVGEVRSNYDYRRNKITGEELAQCHTAYVANAERVLEQKSGLLADLEFNSIEFGMKDVLVDMQRLIKFYSDLDNSRYCIDCQKRNRNYSRSCECGSVNLVTMKPTCAFPAKTSGSKFDTTRKYEKYEKVIPRCNIPSAGVYFDRMVDVNPNNLESIKIILAEIAPAVDDPLKIQKIKFLQTDGAINIIIQAMIEDWVPITAMGHCCFLWMDRIRRVLMHFFGPQYELVINLKSDKARDWLKTSGDNHLLAQIILSTYQAFIFILKNDQVFDLQPTTRELLNFIVYKLIGPWMIWRISTRNGNVDLMMKCFYSYFLNLAVISNSYHYTHMQGRKRLPLCPPCPP